MRGLQRYKPLKRTRIRCKPAVTHQRPPWLPSCIRLDAVEMANLRSEAFKRSNGFCEATTPGGSTCMKRIFWDSFELAHVISRGKGGSDSLDNVLCKCVPCHRGPAGSDHPGPQWSRR